jgi:hypothetical protein
MDKNRIPFAIFIGLSLLMIWSVPVQAIGISPPGIGINFEPGFNETYKYYVRAGSNGNIRIWVRGELAEYIKPSVENLTLNPGEVRWFDVTVELPQELERPGRHTSSIVATESAPPTSTGVGSIAEVSSHFHVEVAYPGKYLEVRLHAQNVNLGKPVIFAVSLTSRGEENVTASSIIKVFNLEGNNLATLYTSEELIESKKSGSLEAEWDTSGIPPGLYFANTSVEYGADEPVTASTSFKIGDVLIKIINVSYQDDIQPGDIVKFDVELDSYWNEKITDAFITLGVLKDGEEVGSSTSETFDIAAWRKKVVRIFWDTEDLEEGEYHARFTVNYLEKTTEKTIEVEIKPTPNPLIDLIPYIIAAVLIAIIAVIAIYARRRRKGKEGHG